MTENIKCVLVGDGAVGKTCLLMSYANNKFPDDYVPTVFDNYNATVLFENKHVSLGLWDTAGEEDYDRLRPLSYPETNVFIMCYSVVDRSSFENIKTKWYPEIQEHAPGIPILMSGNKVDLRDTDLDFMREMRERNERPVTTEEMRKMIDELRIEGGFETSAKTFVQLKELFHEAIKLVLAPSDGGNRRRRRRNNGTCHML